MLNNIFILVSCTCLFFSFYIFIKAKKIKVLKSNEQEEEIQKIQKISQELVALSEDKSSALEELQLLIKKKEHLKQDYIIYQHEIDQNMINLKDSYEKTENDFNQKIINLQQLKSESEQELNRVQEYLNAGVKAKLQEREVKEKINFYKLSISEADLSDIQALNKIKNVLHQPVILSKLIWSSFFLKQTNDLCARVVGLTKKCGIYKITNINTSEIYIGQSVDIAQRWKDHIKCGCGIDASATNKLYKAMQEEGVWNFSFEVLEECSRAELNARERFWIKTYSSDKYGYNSTKGNK